MGTEFRENVVRAVINQGWEEKGGEPALLLEMVKDPEFIPESPERARAIRMDDREAKAELEKAQLEARALMDQRQRSAQEIALKDSRIAELEAKLAEVGAEPVSTPIAEKPESVRSGGPNATWTRPELLTYAEQNGIAIKNKQFATKVALLEAILSTGQAADEVTA